MKRFSVKIVPYLSLSGFISFLTLGFMLMSMFLSEEKLPHPLVFVALVLGSLILGIAYAYLYYKLSGYEFNDKGVSVTRGVLYRKKSFLEYNNIHAVNKKQNLIEKLLGTARLMIDSGSANTASTAEIIIYEDTRIVDDLMNKLKNSDSLADEEVVEDKSEKKNLFAYTKKLKLFNALIDSIRNGFSLLLIILAFIAIPFFINIAGEVDLFLQILIGVICLILLGYILVLFGGIIRSFVHYYNFKIYRLKDEIEINYGLFTTYNHSFKLNRIKAVIVKQPFFYRLFGYASILLEVIGYSEDESNGSIGDNYLIPICKIDDADELIEKIIGGFNKVELEDRSKSYFSLFSWRMLYLSIFTVLLGITLGLILPVVGDASLLLPTFITLLLFYLVVLGYMMINSYLQIKYEGVGIESDRMTIYHGGFKRTRTTILNKHIIGLTDTTTPLRRKKGIYSYSVHIKTNAMSNEYPIEILDEAAKDKILNVVKY